MKKFCYGKNPPPTVGSSSKPWSTCCWHFSSLSKDITNHDCLRRCPCLPSTKATGWLYKAARSLRVADQQLCPRLLPGLPLEPPASFLAANPHLYTPSSACCLAGSRGNFLSATMLFLEILKTLRRSWGPFSLPALTRRLPLHTLHPGLSHCWLWNKQSEHAARQGNRWKICSSSKVS